ncbi:unnamed protein product [Zymoseptoria tritici ST99CH_3D7]|uniref:Uncharacterized protein n=1 Tax=Zymoseptoria tritici (strain ST99CH_3D7) TaxID=1276538 RepID=A0A1X7RSL9_ZYMT9|nr:unnamed protein product [Zymoseptoria tritici ST99CH_3D7]
MIVLSETGPPNRMRACELSNPSCPAPPNQRSLQLVIHTSNSSTPDQNAGPAATLHRNASGYPLHHHLNGLTKSHKPSRTTLNHTAWETTVSIAIPAARTPTVVVQFVNSSFKDYVSRLPDGAFWVTRRRAGEAVASEGAWIREHEKRVIDCLWRT